MSTQTHKTIKITPTWAAAARIYIAALEDGTAEGKRLAREAIMEMASLLDQFNAEDQ